MLPKREFFYTKNMGPQSTGSFGNPAGGMSPALQEAIQRRSGGQQGPMNAVTQGAPTFDPTTQPAQPPQGQISQPQPQMGAQPMGQPAPDQSQSQAGPATPFDPAELKMITGALTGRLKLIGGIQEALVGIPPKGS